MNSQGNNEICPATFLKNNTIININSIDNVVYEYEKEMIIINQKGESEATFVAYYDKGEKIYDIEIVISSIVGKTIKKVKKAEIKDVSNYRGLHITDRRVKYFETSNSTFPYKVKISYKKNSPNTLGMDVWYPYGFKECSDSPTLEINNKTDSEVAFKINNNEKEVIKTVEKSNSKLVFKVEEVPFVKNEAYNKPFYAIAPHVRLRLKDFNFYKEKGTVSTWEEFGEWKYNELVKDTRELSLALMQKLTALTKDIEDTKEKIDTVYKFFQQKQRYVSLQYGIGGFKPIPAQEVYENGYGDCKGLSNLFVASLNYLKIPAKYIQIRNERDYNYFYDESFFSLNGNHIIAMVPLKNDSLWYECTSKDYPPGYLGFGSYNRNCLVSDENGGALVSTPQKDYSSQNLEIDFYEKDGKWSAKGVWKHRGHFFDWRLGDLWEGDDEKIETIASILNISEDIISNYNYEYGGKEDLIIETFEIENWKNISQNLGAMVMLKTPLPYSYSPKEIEKENRTQNIYFPIQKQYNLVLRFHLESDKKMDSIEPFAFENEFGKIDFNIEQDESIISITKSTTFNSGDWEPKHIENLLEWHKNIKNTKNIKPLILK